MSSCVPKKVTWNAAAMAETLHEAKAYGFDVDVKHFDWPVFTAKRDAYVRRLNGIYSRNLANDSVTYIPGRARFRSPTEVEVDEQTAEGHKLGSKAVYSANHILVATGGYPIIPKDIPGAEHGISSDGFFELTRQPKKVVLVGAGYIAIELAGMFRALGSETHLMIRHDSFLRSFDPIIQDVLAKHYESGLGIVIHRRSRQTRIDKDPASGKLRVHYEDAAGPAVLDDVDVLLWAIGRAPDVADLDLPAVGVAQGRKGYIAADEFQNTNVPGVYSLGDVAGTVELTPVAIAAGRRLADRLFGGVRDAKLDYSNIPSVIFAHPEAGTVGLSEPDARAKYGDDNVKVYRTSFVAMYYALMEPDQKGPTSYKLVCAGPDEKVVGLHIVGLGSAEMLQGFGVAIKMGATKKLLSPSPRPVPGVNGAGGVLQGL